MRHGMGWVIVIGLAYAATPAPGAANAIVSQVDHVLFVTPGGRALVSLLTETLALPIVFPQAGEDWTQSTGIGLGNVTLEVFHRPPAPEGAAPAAGRITSLALQPTDFKVASDELTLRSIDHFPPAVGPRYKDDSTPRWMTIGLRGFGHGMFLIQHNFDMNERRSRFDRLLREREGGALGVVRVREVAIAPDQLDRVRERWSTLFGPPASGQADVWVIGSGPRIRLVRGGDSRAGSLVIEVRSLSRASEALRRLGIAAETANNEIRIDSGRMFGLRMFLQAQSSGPRDR